MIGLAGSGKTTLSKELSEQYNAKYIETDQYFLKYHRIFKKENGRRSTAKEIKGFSNKIITDIKNDIKSTKEKSVWEGIWLLDNTDFILKYPFIIKKNTSQIKALYRTIVRDINRNK